MEPGSQWRTTSLAKSLLILLSSLDQNINHGVQLLAGSDTKNFRQFNSNAGFIFSNEGSSGEGRSRGCDDDWDDEDW